MTIIIYYRYYIHTGGKDYQVKSEIVSFSGGGDTMKLVMVTILDDLLSEKTEYFTMSIEPINDDVAFPISDAVVGIEDNDGIMSHMHAHSV